MQTVKHNQDGVTLILALLIMSGIAIITVTVSFFVIQEIRASRASTLTEPAIIAAETAGERGIYQIKRAGVGSVLTCSESIPYTQLSGVTGGSTNTRVRTCLDFIPAVFELGLNQEPLDFYLYDPANINGNLCLETGTCDPATGLGQGSQIYSAVNVRYLNGTSNVRINIVTLDGVSVVNTLISPGTNPSFIIPANIAGSTDERLRVTLTPTSGNVTIEVSTSGTITGLPDYRTVDAQGCVAKTNITNCESTNEIYKRRMNITVPATE